MKRQDRELLKSLLKHNTFPLSVAPIPAKVVQHPSVPQKIEESLEQENESDPSDSTEPQPSLPEQLRARHDLFVDHCSRDYRIRL